MRDLVDLALGGDPEARRLIRESGRHIGEVLAGAVNLLNPEALVIAGDMATRELQIPPSTHGDQPGVIGSAAMILDHVLIDGVIEPHETRLLLRKSLHLLRDKQISRVQRKHGLTPI